jgi:hypothetical protein
MGTVPARGTIDLTVPRLRGAGSPAVVRRAVAAAAPELTRGGHVQRIIVRPGGGPPVTLVRRGRIFV